MIEWVPGCPVSAPEVDHPAYQLWLDDCTDPHKWAQAIKDSYVRDPYELAKWIAWAMDVAWNEGKRYGYSEA